MLAGFHFSSAFFSPLIMLFFRCFRHLLLAYYLRNIVFFIRFLYCYMLLLTLRHAFAAALPYYHIISSFFRHFLYFSLFDTLTPLISYFAFISFLLRFRYYAMPYTLMHFFAISFRCFADADYFLIILLSMPPFSLIISFDAIFAIFAAFRWWWLRHLRCYADYFRWCLRWLLIHFAIVVYAADYFRFSPFSPPFHFFFAAILCWYCRHTLSFACHAFFHAMPLSMAAAFIYFSYSPLFSMMILLLSLHNAIRLSLFRYAFFRFSITPLTPPSLMLFLHFLSIFDAFLSCCWCYATPLYFRWFSDFRIIISLSDWCHFFLFIHASIILLSFADWFRYSTPLFSIFAAYFLYAWFSSLMLIMLLLLIACFSFFRFRFYLFRACYYDFRHFHHALLCYFAIISLFAYFRRLPCLRHVAAMLLIFAASPLLILILIFSCHATMLFRWYFRRHWLSPPLLLSAASLFAFAAFSLVISPRRWWYHMIIDYITDTGGYYAAFSLSFWLMLRQIFFAATPLLLASSLMFRRCFARHAAAFAFRHAALSYARFLSFSLSSSSFAFFRLLPLAPWLFALISPFRLSFSIFFRHYFHFFFAIRWYYAAAFSPLIIFFFHYTLLPPCFSIADFRRFVDAFSLPIAFRLLRYFHYAIIFLLEFSFFRFSFLRLMSLFSFHFRFSSYELTCWLRYAIRHFSLFRHFHLRRFSFHFFQLSLHFRRFRCCFSSLIFRAFDFHTLFLRLPPYYERDASFR